MNKFYALAEIYVEEKESSRWANVIVAEGVTRAETEDLAKESLKQYSNDRVRFKGVYQYLNTRGVVNQRIEKPTWKKVGGKI